MVRHFAEILETLRKPMCRGGVENHFCVVAAVDFGKYSVFACKCTGVPASYVCAAFEGAQNMQV